MQNLFKRCIFQCAAKQGAPEISKISMGRKLVEFVCPCFGLGPAPRAFTKLLKVPMSLLRRLMIQAIIFLENKESVSGGVQSTRDNLVRTNTFVRNINFHYSSFPPSTSSVSVSSTTTNNNTKEESILHGHSDIERYGLRGTCMLDKKFRINQWSGHYSPSLTDTNADRCF